MLLALIVTTCLTDGIYSCTSKEMCVPVEFKIYRIASKKDCSHKQQRKNAVCGFTRNIRIYNEGTDCYIVFIYIHRFILSVIFLEVFVSSFYHH